MKLVSNYFKVWDRRRHHRRQLCDYAKAPEPGTHLELELLSTKRNVRKTGLPLQSSLTVVNFGVEHRAFNL